MQNDGIATIFSGENIASAGNKPEVSYTNKIFESYYEEKTVGVTRYFSAKAQNDRADILIQIQRSGMISTEHRCQLYSFLDNGVSGKYKIIQVQHVKNEDGLPMTDLTLQRVGELDAVD